MASGSAVEYSKRLNDLSFNAKITADPRTNTVIVQSHDEVQLQVIEAILLRLDEAPSAPAATKPDAIEKVREPTERLEVIHRHVKTLATREAISRIAIAGTDIIDVNQLSEKEIAVIGKGVGSTSLTLWFGKNPEPRTILVTVTREGSTAGLETPAAKQLIKQLQAQESAAAAEAATIRQLQANGQAEQNKQPIAEHQRKLKNLLSTAFDLKLQLEELQVKELQSRLSRLERQIGQRKELREKIIARRVGELIEGDTLKWDSTGAASESAAETTSKSKPTNPTPKPAAASEMTTQVHFTGLKGMEVLIADEPEALIAPVRHSFLRHASETQRYDIGFMKAPGFPDLQFVALLDIYPSAPETHGFAASPLPATDEFLRHNTVPITITEADTQHASNELLIKVVYLAKPSRVETAIPEIQTLASTSINRGGDVIAAANQFGTILAVLRLAQNVDQLGKLDPKSSNAAITRPRLPSQEVANGGTAERSTSSPPSYQEFAKKLGTMNSSVAEAEEDLKLAERKVEAKLEPTEIVTKARRQVAEAIRNRKAIQDEYASVLRDLELQIESAQIDVDAAKRDADRAAQLVKTGTTLAKVSEDAQLRLKQATLTLERLRVRSELYKKAGVGVAAEDPLNATGNLSQTPASDGRPDAESAAKLIWEKLGLKFGEPVTAEKLGLLKPKYWGGLPIVEVREAGSAQKNGINKGDVLVGLDRWETISLDNVVWILNQPETLPMSHPTEVRLKFFVLRGGETRYGFLQMAGEAAGTPMNVPPRSTAKPLDQLLTDLRTSRNAKEVTMAAREIGKLVTKDNAEQVAAALMAAAELFDPDSKSDSAASSELLNTLYSLDRSAKLPAAVHALRDGSPRVWQYAMSCVGMLKDCTSEKDFPAFAEQVLKHAAKSDGLPRTVSLRLLAQTLPITELKADDFSTEERREMARRLTEHVPRSLVISLLTKALDGKDIDAAVLATAELAKLSDNTKSEIGPAQLLDVLTSVLKGKRDEVVATKQQRGQALVTLSSLQARAAPAVPVLIELLKSDDPDLKPVRQPFDQFGVGESGQLISLFTRDSIIFALERIGSHAKDVLPDLEAAVVVLEKKEKEDALLSPNAPPPPNKPSEQLRNAISKIKSGGIKRS
ncbi:MAG: pilus assembly protein N-terminal domain-containing protein [Planctomycetaceae bacterium]|nr:pilus assembly protein N-terminal domain-containing protein [Planctomycetaceae bacterium]